MNCSDFAKRLHEQFGSVQFDQPPELEEHANRCAACRTALDQMRLLADSLPAWREQVPEVDLTGAVLAGWQSALATSGNVSRGKSVPSASFSRTVPEPSPTASLAGIVARPLPV